MTVDIASVTLPYIFSLPSVMAYQKDELPENEGGIYFVTVRVPEFKILYIGMAARFYTRWHDHHQLDRIEVLQMAGIIVYIHWLTLDWSSVDMDLMESAMIRKFKPPFNGRKNKPNLEDEVIVPIIPEDIKLQVISQLDKPLEVLNPQRLHRIALSLYIKMPMKRIPAKVLLAKIKECLGEHYEKYKIERTKKIAMERYHEDFASALVGDELIVIPREMKNTIDSWNAEDPLSYNKLGIRDMRKIASKLGIKGYGCMTKYEMVYKIQKLVSWKTLQEESDPGDPTPDPK